MDDVANDEAIEKRRAFLLERIARLRHELRNAEGALARQEAEEQSVNGPTNIVGNVPNAKG